MDLSNRFGWACLLVSAGFAVVGFLDDYDKVTKASHRGIPGRVRLLIEFLIAGVAVLLIVSRTGTDLYLPFFTDVYIPLGPLYYVFAMVLIVGFGNAVNLTDGLDGLATRSEEHTSELQSLMRISYAVSSLKEQHEHRL